MRRGCTTRFCCAVGGIVVGTFSIGVFAEASSSPALTQAEADSESPAHRSPPRIDHAGRSPPFPKWAPISTKALEVGADFSQGFEVSVDSSRGFESRADFSYSFESGADLNCGFRSKRRFERRPRANAVPPLFRCCSPLCKRGAGGIRFRSTNHDAENHPAPAHHQQRTAQRATKPAKNTNPHRIPLSLTPRASPSA